MMDHTIAPVAGGVLAFLVTGFSAWFINRRSNKPPGWLRSLPLLFGLLFGCAVLGLLNQSYAPFDRYFSSTDACSVLLATFVGCVVMWSVEVLVPKTTSSFIIRVIAHLISQLLAASLLVWAGVQFDLMKLPGVDVTALSPFAGQLLTLAWLVIATNIVRLFDGIHGAAATLVMLAALGALLVTANNGEFFLSGMSLMTLGIAGGILYFSASRNRLPQEGSGTAILGLLFAILTVLARQKTVAAALLITPIILIILIAGAAMLGLLKNRLLLPGQADTDENPKPVSSED